MSEKYNLHYDAEHNTYEVEGITFGWKEPTDQKIQNNNIILDSKIDKFCEILKKSKKV